MKKRRFSTAAGHSGLAALCAAALLGLCPAARGDSALQTNSFVLAEDGSVGGALWLAAKSVDVRGTMRDDFFFIATQSSLVDGGEAGSKALLAGTFENDVWGFAEELELSGTVFDHARLFAQALNVSGAIHNGALLAGTTVTIATNGCLGGPAIILGEAMICEGRCEDDVTFIGMSATLSGLFLGDVRITAGEIVLLPGTEIAGDLVYASPSELILDRNVVLHGSLVRSAREAAGGKPDAGPLAMSNLLAESWLYCGALLTALVFLRLFTRPSAAAALDVRRAFWKCLLAGFVGIAMLVLTAVFAAFSVIGIQLAGVCLAAAWILLYLGKIFSGAALGLAVLRRPAFGSFGGLFGACAAGMLLLYLGANVPGLGLFVQAFSTLAGLGALILNLVPGRNLPPPLPPAA